MKLPPASRNRSSSAREAASSASRPKVIAPRQSSLTRTPVLPRYLSCMESLSNVAPRRPPCQAKQPALTVATVWQLPRRADRLAGGQLAVDPAIELGTTLQRGDQRVARLRADASDHVPQPLRVDDHLPIPGRGNPRFGGRVVLVLAEDHVRLRKVAQLQPGADDPALAVGIEPIVFVEMHLPQDVLAAGVGSQLDHPYATVARADVLDVLHQRRTDILVVGPDAVLVWLAVRPESSALHLALCRGDGGEVGVPTGLPIHELEALELMLGDLGPLVVLEDHEALLLQYR